MGYHDLDHSPPPTDESVLGVTTQALSVLADLLALAVRCLGVVLLLAGLWTAMEVVAEAWTLYRDPQNIIALAGHIEMGSGIDALVRSVQGNEAANAPPLRLSVLMAWFVAPVLLFTAGYLAMLAVRTGGELALGPARRGR